MRQIMPHRNNIAMHRTKCKAYFGGKRLSGRQWAHNGP